MNKHEPGEITARYEKTHLRGRPFVVGTICFFVLMAAIFVIVWTLLQGWSREPWPHRSAALPPSARAGWDVKVPQIQIDPTADLIKVREREDRHLHASHWNDAGRTYATIPIESAMKLLVDAAAKNQLTAVLPAPQPATPLELQDQKSREISSPQPSNP